MIPTIFDAAACESIIQRINSLTPNTERLWGTMTVDQMLAHCNVPYAYTFMPEQFKQPNFFMKWMLKNFVKKMVVSENPYKQNERTSPSFIISNARDFEKEKAILIKNIENVKDLGATHFEGKENFSFGKMTAQEWSNMYYKHLDHHLRQFGV